MVLKLLAILPSGSAGKFLKKIWNLEKWGGVYDQHENYQVVYPAPFVRYLNL
ncbi:hypothetical protein QH294_2760 [Enterococcus faecalis]|nr:hypothetical protein QH294_2760 [Enterococcus faecalis]